MLAIFDVGVAVECDQVSFFKQHADEDVTCRRDGEQQMSGCHRGRRPEREQETEINRMTDEFVE